MKKEENHIDYGKVLKLTKQLEKYAEFADDLILLQETLKDIIKREYQKNDISGTSKSRHQ